MTRKKAFSERSRPAKKTASKKTPTQRAREHVQHKKAVKAQKKEYSDWVREQNSADGRNTTGNPGGKHKSRMRSRNVKRDLAVGKVAKNPTKYAADRGLHGYQDPIPSKEVKKAYKAVKKTLGEVSKRMEKRRSAANQRKVNAAAKKGRTSGRKFGPKKKK